MPTVRTDLGHLRESARRMRVEPTGGITATNTQKALEGLDSGKLPAYLGATQVTTATYVAQTTDTELYVNRAGAVTITLPTAASWLAADKRGLSLTIVDVSGAADANNITINRADGDTIDGNTSLTINTKYGGFRLRPLAAGGWVIV